MGERIPQTMPSVCAIYQSLDLLKTWNQNYLVILLAMQNAKNQSLEKLRKAESIKPCFYKAIKQKQLRRNTEVIMFGETERAKSHLKITKEVYS